jgi:hypothetical protein
MQSEELLAKRVMVRERSHIPGPFWAVLYLVAILKENRLRDSLYRLLKICF